MSVKQMIKCNYCKKEVPYFNTKLYKIVKRFGKNKQFVCPDDMYRYCSEKCAANEIKSNKVNRFKYFIKEITQ